MLSIWKSLDNLLGESDELLDSWLHPSKALGIEQKHEKDGTLTVTVELPGVEEVDINVEVSPKGFVVTVKGQKNTKTSSYSVVKSFLVADHYDANLVKAELKNGIVTLTVPGKALPPAKEVKKIPVTIKK